MKGNPSLLFSMDVAKWSEHHVYAKVHQQAVWICKWWSKIVEYMKQGAIEVGWDQEKMYPLIGIKLG